MGHKWVICELHLDYIVLWVSGSNGSTGATPFQLCYVYIHRCSRHILNSYAAEWGARGLNPPHFKSPPWNLIFYHKFSSQLISPELTTFLCRLSLYCTLCAHMHSYTSTGAKHAHTLAHKQRRNAKPVATIFTITPTQ